MSRIALPSIFLTLLLILFNSQISYTQIEVDSIIISSNTQEVIYPTANKAKYNDSLMNSTFDLLLSAKGVQLQNSTAGGLATILYRGLSNRQIPVLWNGINIQNIINQTYDYNLIPISLFDQSYFNEGIVSNMSGFNTSTGAFFIKQNQKKSFASLSFNTLQNYNLSAAISKSYGKTLFNIGIAAGYDQNIYKFAQGNLHNIRESSDWQKLDIVSSIQHKWNKRIHSILNIWIQDHNRNILSSITSTTISQSQKDKNTRIVFSNIKQSLVTKWEFSNTYMDENTSFFTPIVNSVANAKSFNSKLAYSRLTNNEALFYIQYRHDLANANFFNAIYNRNTWQFSGFKKWLLSNKASISTSFRQDLIDNKWMPFTFGLKANYKNSVLSIQKNYNIPGFNDLYWPGAGNINLVTESSLLFDISQSLKSTNWHYSASIYSHHIDNWIQWIPNSNNIWSPVNQKKVWARGIEASVNHSIIYHNISFHSLANITYNRTTNIEAYAPNTTLSKQTIYSPIITGRAAFTASYKKQQYQISYNYSGFRYDTPDNSNKLPDIHLINILYSLYYKQHSIAIGINNILNKNYQLVRFYPLPGVNAECKYTLHL